MTKAGFVSISGQPNVGKSTLLNALIGEKVAIVSPKPETTRDNIRGILTEGDSQIIFIDTPGLHKPHDLLGRIMVTRAESSILEADIILFLTEARFALGKEDGHIIARLPDPKEKKTVILVINKVDRVRDKKSLLPLMEKAGKVYPFNEIIPMCSLKEEDIERLKKTLKNYLPEGPFLYPEDELSDKSERFMIQEIIREKILLETFEEIPHSVAVVIDHMEEDENNGPLRIFATIFIERDSQKPIIIGKGGMKLKEIGRLARIDVEEMLSRKIHLELWVKVQDKWKKDPNALREMGYSDENA